MRMSTHYKTNICDKRVVTNSVRNNVKTLRYREENMQNRTYWRGILFEATAALVQHWWVNLGLNEKTPSTLPSPHHTNCRAWITHNSFLHLLWFISQPSRLLHNLKNSSYIQASTTETVNIMDMLSILQKLLYTWVASLFISLQKYEHTPQIKWIGRDLKNQTGQYRNIVDEKSDISAWIECKWVDEQGTFCTASSTLTRSLGVLPGPWNAESVAMSSRSSSFNVVACSVFHESLHLLSLLLTVINAGSPVFEFLFFAFGTFLGFPSPRCEKSLCGCHKDDKQMQPDPHPHLSPS